MVLGDRGLQRRVAFSVSEAAAALGVSVGLLRSEIARGRLLSTRVGRRVVILEQQLRAYLARSAQ